MNNLLEKRSILYLITEKRINKIEDMLNNPIRSQRNILKKLIQNGLNTMFGEEHEFNKIKDYSNFASQIPIRDYESLYKYINKILKGEENILWPGKVQYFAKSSGTSNAKSKYIPITKESLEECHFKAGKDLLSLYLNNFPNKNIYRGKGLMLGGSVSLSKNTKYKTGDLSGILLDQFPFWVNYHRIPDVKTALMKEWETKIQRIIDQSINENITNITGVPSWMLILLNKLLEKSDKRNILEIWPNLEVYIHGGVNFSPYKRRFEDLIPSKSMNYIEGYNASEGFFAIQDLKKSKGLLLLLDHGVFYEFIPINKIREGIKEAIPIEDTKLNTKYAMVISTNGGLWRYLIGDVIEFLTLNPYRIKLVGRIKNCINTFGEELMVHNTESALQITTQKFNCQISEYTVAPIFINKDSGGHQWLIEFKKRPNDMNQFINHLDDTLKKINSDYAAKRYKNLILKEPTIVDLQKNCFYQWLKKKKKLGGQNKIPRLYESRDIAKELLDINQSLKGK